MVDEGRQQSSVIGCECCVGGRNRSYRLPRGVSRQQNQEGVKKAATEVSSAGSGTLVAVVGAITVSQKGWQGNNIRRIRRRPQGGHQLVMMY